MPPHSDAVGDAQQNWEWGRYWGVKRQDAEDAADAKLREPDWELDRIAHAVVDAALEVHRALGPGFLETVYERALAIELSRRGIPFERQVRVALSYKGAHIGEARLDLLVAQRLVVELKACEDLPPIHRAQVLSYLRATRLQLGLVINFNVRLLRQGIRRVILTDVQSQESNAKAPKSPRTPNYEQ